MVGYPPVGAMARVEFRHSDRRKVAAWGREAGDLLSEITRGHVKVLGPIEPPIARLEGQHRLHLLLKASSRKRLREALSKLLDGHLGKLAGRHMLVEIDPYSLL
jgi:primosomal protein N' (replication factor Y)